MGETKGEREKEPDHEQKELKTTVKQNNVGDGRLKNVEFEVWLGHQSGDVKKGIGHVSMT